MPTTNTAAALTTDAKKQLAANKKRGTALLALIDRRKTRISLDFYDIGEALKELLDNMLYSAMGFDSFEQMLDARKVMGATQAFKLIRLVEGIPRDQALRLGQEKAYALVTYTAATPEQDVPAALVRRNAKARAEPPGGATNHRRPPMAVAIAPLPKRPAPPDSTPRQPKSRAGSAVPASPDVGGRAAVVSILTPQRHADVKPLPRRRSA